MHAFRALRVSAAATRPALQVGSAQRAMHLAARVAPTRSHSLACSWGGAGLLRPAFASRSSLLASPSASSSCSSFPASPVLRGSGRRHKSCGIIGLPNVGKSTLFNALTDTQLAEASNYPFCTIEPNIALVSVPDPLLVQLSTKARTNKVLFSQVKFVDIAGIIKGASAGAGLGNKFLQNIKDVDVLLHVIRCFDNSEIIHVSSRINPLEDMETIETELLLADLQTIEKRMENAEKHKNKKSDASSAGLIDRPAFYAKCREALNAGVALVDVVFDSQAERDELQSMQLITAKPMAYVCNVDESATAKHNAYTQLVFDAVEAANKKPAWTLPSGLKVSRVPRFCLRVCSQLESEVQTFDTAEARAEFLAMNDLSSTSLLPIIQTSNKLLKNICYYTVGEQEARAWTIEEGTLAPAAAAKIHSDLQKGFVCAEVVKPADYLKHGDAGVREQGLMKVHGRDYVVQDQDILVFRVQGQKGR